MTPLTGIPELNEGDDLADAIDVGLAHTGVELRDGDVIVVSSKIASKALGLVTDDPDKERVVPHETEYVLAERSVAGKVTRIVRGNAGPIMAAPVLTARTRANAAVGCCYPETRTQSASRSTMS